MKKSYHTINKQGKANERKLAEFFSHNRQLLLPMVDLIEQCQVACDELIDITGRATIQAVLQLSAEQVAGGPPQQGKRRIGDVGFHGQQAGMVMLSDRKLQVQRPRLREKGPGTGKEVEIPAYAAMHNQPRLSARMLDILMRGVSTRQYKAVIPEMADTVGVSKSSVSRQIIEASEAEVEAPLSRRFDDVKLLVIYIDGMAFGDHVLVGAVGVDAEGNKHVLAIREGATENSTVTKELLEDLVARGVNPEQKRLFVIDGSKALRAAINAVFGTHQPVQRCRIHKLRNVMDHLPEDQKEQVKSVLRAAWKMDAKTGMARLRKRAEWLEREYPSAAGSLLEGLEECFRINRLDVPPSLHRCLATTNLIESPQSGVRMRTRRVCRWRDGGMVKRWMASAFLATEKNFRKMMATEIYGLWKRSSTDRSLPPDRRWRSNMGTGRRYRLPTMGGAASRQRSDPAVRPYRNLSAVASGVGRASQAEARGLRPGLREGWRSDYGRHNEIRLSHPCGTRKHVGRDVPTFYARPCLIDRPRRTAFLCWGGSF